MASWGACKLAIAILAASLLVPFGSPAPAAADDVVVDPPDAGADAVIGRYRGMIPGLMAREGVPGLALAVVDADRVVWQEGFGTTDVEASVPVTPDTMFSVQSMSKVFTATAVLQAVGAGLLDLDAPITAYLPEFTVNSAFESHPERRITLRMLLGHTAGFTHEARLGNNYERDPRAWEDHVRSISETWLRFRAGTGYAYSNLGIDLAAAILERVSGDTFATRVDETLLRPLGMTHSTFDRERILATTDRAVGHGDPSVPPMSISPMTGAGGLWASAADLARFLRFELGDGIVDGATILDPALMAEMRTVPAPHAGEPAGYALGVARTRWRREQGVDLLSHGGGGLGFLADLWWAPQLGLGIAVLTNDSDHDLQGSLALSILGDLVDESPAYRARRDALTPQDDVVEPDGHWVPPGDLATQIAAAAMAPEAGQAERWAGYVGTYRTGAFGGMDPTVEPSRFLVSDGVPVFVGTEDRTAIRHRLTEVQPGVFLAANGETLDLRGPTLTWRGMNLERVTDGPLPWQWAMLAVLGGVAVLWFAGGAVALVRRRRRRMPASATVGVERRWHLVAAVLASLVALAMLATIAVLLAMPALADVGFLGWMLLPMPMRLALHLPLVVALLAGMLLTLWLAGWARGWWSPRSAPRLAALAGGAAVMAAQLAAWHLVGFGLA